MLTFSDIIRITELINYPGLEIRACLKDQTPYLQIHCDGVCNVTGEKLKWSGRKWMLSFHMIPDEIVRAAYKAVLAALEHEAREKFKYKGTTVFNPHMGIDHLVEISRRSNALSARPDNRVMQ